MELRNYSNEFYGHVGVKANFTDSNGDTLYVGDVVRIVSEEDISDLSVVCGDKANKEFNVMGIWNCQPFSKDTEWKVYKEKSYMSMKEGDEIYSLKYTKDEHRKMTISEIEKELGYPIEVIKEREEN